MSNISVVMITLNEERAISKVINDINCIVPDSEILIVDSSTDKTPDIAHELGCKVIRQYPPQGYGKAMELALMSANNEIIITLDCDDTYPTKKIPELVYWMEQGYDIVNASRLGNKKPKNMPFGNYLANWFFAFSTKLLFGIQTTDIHSGMRAYKKEMIHNIQWNPAGAAFPVELLIKPIQMGYKMKEIPIDYNERIGDVTMRAFSSTMWTIKRLFHLKF
ncbi:glycosyltransferase family 2 protein [Methanospirillum purgamenti]|uniref:Glycosyltransferase family 2 protein n=1 Tax=Methanospirillum hungatei TaxID=2203 RepID=A0A8F5VMA5_METHU|nr:glycosyltransferase family 2 protein [Methanospirillum hungatei]QXO93528.1 glycosyltransferase family 2 protein [Methanospirillum hungatei]